MARDPTPADLILVGNEKVHEPVEVDPFGKAFLG
jgi:hypothetical protein